ncbi:MAG TPA: ABC transporter substrate-binding protein [Deltaproteobacteria bacterium]|nr:ABC transporter substrate-binding protein [Deltaproteobacteria bacterium]
MRAHKIFGGWRTLFVGFILIFLSGLCWGGDTLNQVQSKKMLRCGVSEGVAGFSLRDRAGRWSGMDVDFCRAVAAAAFGDPERVTFVPLKASERFYALSSKAIDLLSSNATWTLGREAGIGLYFTGTLFYTSQGFMVRRTKPQDRLQRLRGQTICVEKGTTHIEDLDDYFKSKKWSYNILVLESKEEIEKAFFSGKCRAYTSDVSELAAARLRAPGGAQSWVILPDEVSKQPLSPAVRRDDPEWFTLVRWVYFALIEAEELGLTRANIWAKARVFNDAAVMRYFKKSSDYGKALGVKNMWAIQVIESTGNYGEIFERNLGRKSDLRLKRGRNHLWRAGGLMVSPSFR